MLLELICSKSDSLTSYSSFIITRHHAISTSLCVLSISNIILLLMFLSHFSIFMHANPLFLSLFSTMAPLRVASSGAPSSPWRRCYRLPTMTPPRETSSRSTSSMTRASAYQGYPSTRASNRSRSNTRYACMHVHVHVYELYICILLYCIHRIICLNILLCPPPPYH